jgi:hypothetical protein
LEASPEGKGLFERFGFRVVERLVYLDGSYVECCMIRGGRGEKRVRGKETAERRDLSNGMMTCCRRGSWW